MTGRYSAFEALDKGGNLSQDIASSGQPVNARVKWFSATKGFGFVAPEGAGGDAFIHISVLQRAGIQDLGIDAEILCLLEQGAKGLQVTQIIEVISQGDLSQSSRPAYSRLDRLAQQEPPSGEGEPGKMLSGIVKWYKFNRGYGFIVADDQRDVFVHRDVLRRCGIRELASNQRVQMKVQDSARGQEAVWVRLI